ncbi:HET-domain-containing protein [Didymella exigua CBS 183.55]|uniref:HET-domain-containing protein n=1 Tax=Didymella exigua CBS 183.55 TaxID=1150837 RepID=A0A6A5RN56_9PLEO|nr:HET-domain-containing protein [Didymella exigua CBS 183.55]KAF1928873.1 HET-domain-containing protein [Didymella exigua CBS 183.55]
MLCSTCLHILQQDRNLLYYEDRYINLFTPLTFEASLRQDRGAGTVEVAEAKDGCGIRSYWSGRYGHHPRLSDFRNSVRSNCHVCWQAWNGMKVEGWMNLADADGAKIEEISTTTGWPFLTYAGLRFNGDDGFVSYTIWLKDQKAWRKLSSFTLYPGTIDGLGPPSATLTTSSTSSRESLTLAKAWLEECVSCHSTCSQDFSPTQWYPTRLLDLGCDDREFFNLRLVTSQDEALKGPYTTLSHRWGDASFLKLTTQNFNWLRIDIDTVELPVTFHEAIKVSRELQARYLWIDSLCIIQDSPSDWASEASQMGKVYSNALCNISASHAGDSSSGLFHDRNPHVLGDMNISICKNDKCVSESAHPLYLLSNDWLGRKSITECALSRRGWVFQERMLARRVLHFCHDQIVWECHKHIACEQYPYGFPPTIWCNQPNYLAKVDQPSAKQTELIPWLEFWDSMVDAYTGTSLTRSEDKLVALSGIAKVVAAKMEDTYIAGMWRRILEQSLMWSIASPAATRPDGYRAPTWSWASNEGVIKPASHLECSLDGKDLAIWVKQVHLDYTTDDMTGQIRGGWLDLQGYLQPLYLFPWRRGTEYSWRIGGWFLATTILSDRIQGLMRTSISDFLTIDDQAVDDVSILEQCGDLHLFCLPCHRTTGDAQTDIDKGRNVFLLLQLIDTENRLFERIGRAAIYDPEHLAWIQEELGDDVKEELSIFGDEDGLHTIRII